MPAKDERKYTLKDDDMEAARQLAGEAIAQILRERGPGVVEAILDARDEAIKAETMRILASAADAFAGQGLPAAAGQGLTAAMTLSTPAPRRNNAVRPALPALSAGGLLPPLSVQDKNRTPRKGDIYIGGQHGRVRRQFEVESYRLPLGERGKRGAERIVIVKPGSVKMEDGSTSAARNMSLNTLMTDYKLAKKGP